MDIHVQELAKKDAYLQQACGTVMAALPEGVVLDRTPFYARGGGQPGDQGWLRWAGRSVRVVDTVRVSGVPVHVLEGAPPPAGTEVKAEIDWTRRYRLMRTHTALHILNGIVWLGYRAHVTGVNMEPGEGRIDFELQRWDPQTFARHVEARANEEVDADRPIRVDYLPREEALANPDVIRSRTNLLPEGIASVRVVEIVGLDLQADGGTHVRSTKEVGAIRILKADSKGRANKRLRMALSD